MSQQNYQPTKTATLVFVPNKYCNFGCQYCYLGEATNCSNDSADVAESLRLILDAYLKHNTVINQLSLHGAEVTTLSKDDFENMFKVYFEDYVPKNDLYIRLLGKRVPYAHIKSNMYLIDRHFDTLRKYNITISGSIDLPLKLHNKSRPLKNGNGTVDKILDNIKKMMADPILSKRLHLSTTMTREHYQHLDEFMDDIIYLDSLGIDMVSNFYIMFTYDTANQSIKTQLLQDEMVDVYRRLLKRFKGTKYEHAIYYSWFHEFTHDMCTNVKNCCERDSLLVQVTGDVTCCHRSQGIQELKFGNILKDDFKVIEHNASKQMEEYENNNKPLSKNCVDCHYFYLCYNSCPIIRRDTNTDKSYTCKLQLELYKSQPERFPPNEIASRIAVDGYIKNMQKDYYKSGGPRVTNLNTELFEYKNSLLSIVSRDNILQNMFKPEAFKIILSDEVVSYLSTAVSTTTISIDLLDTDDICLLVDKEYIDFKLGIEKIDNMEDGIIIDMLNDTMITYGDEQRTKMSHIGNNGRGYYIPISDFEEIGKYYMLNISKYFKDSANKFNSSNDDKEHNLVTFVSRKMREYHYFKHSQNAFYHLETINIPFHSFWFNYKHNNI